MVNFEKKIKKIVGKPVGPKKIKFETCVEPNVKIKKISKKTVKFEKRTVNFIRIKKWYQKSIN